jgi:hypothetical protein
VRSTQRLAWIGRDAADVHTYLAGKWVERGRLDDAIAEYQRSLAIHENPDARLVLRELESAAALAAGAPAPAAERVSSAVD